MSALTILTSKRTVSAIVCSLSIAAMAATPVAVWDGDFTTLTKGTFTLSENGNTKTDSYLQISGDNGITVTTTDELNVFTVIMRCSGLNLASDKAQVLFTSYGADASTAAGINDNMTGVYLPTNNAVCRGIWQAADWNNGATQGSVPANYTTLIYNHQQTSGTYAYALGPTSSTDETVVRTTLYSVVGLRSSGTTYKGFAVGGLRGTTSTTLLPATGLKITSLAVFSGTLTEDEMKGYKFFSELPQVTEDTTVSALNTRFSGETALELGVASGVTITMDAAFAASSVKLRSMGNVRLAADVQPSTEELAKLDLTGVQGGLLRSWLTPGVVGFNFYNNKGGNTSGALAAGTWYSDAGSANGTSTAMFADGLSALTWASKELWSAGTGSILSGYLDDGAKNGHGAEVYLSNVPYATYDVIIYCNSDSGNGNFHAKTVNGTTYTWDSSTSAVVAGSAAWGKSNLSIPVYGVNALRIKNLTGPLSIYGGERASGSGTRGGIAAIQIMPPNTPDNINYYTLTLSGAATSWSGGTWTLNGQTVDGAPTSGYVKIVASASTALTVDQEVSLADLVVTGAVNAVVNVATNDAGSLYAIKATVESGVFQQGSPAVLGTTPSIVVASGATFDENGMAVNAANAVTIAGAGAGNWPWALTSSSGAGGAILGGLYLSANATIGGVNELKVGQTGAGYYCYLQGFTLTKTGAGAFTGTNMNTPGTGTIEVQGGDMSVNQWNNLNSASGDTTVILNSGTSLTNGTDRVISMSALGLYGGTLSTASRAFKVKTALRGAGETANLAFGDGASASLTGDLTVKATMTLDGSMTFLKDQEAASDVVVTPAALTASSGTITVGSGVTFNVGTSRPTATFDVDDDATLAVQLQSNADVVGLSVSAQPSNLVVYAADGVQIDKPRITYSGGTLTIMAHIPTLSVSGSVAFDTAENWEDSLMPAANGDAIIELSGDARITVGGTYQLGNLTITGAGTAGFSGDGSVTAVNISLKNGAALTRNSNISATTGISLDSGTVLKIDGVTESAAISGAGSVVTYGTVVLAHANTMTGGITVKTGSLLSASAAGAYGEYQSGWAYTAQRRVIVEDGGTVDINNIANADSAVALVIAGKGVLVDGEYAGAVKYSGSNAITSGSRQISSLVLMGDALVDLGAGWGLIHSGWSNAQLGLNGHTLTVRGTSTFPIANVNNLAGAATSGKLILDGATLELSSACNLTNVNIVAKGCATINLATAPSALGSLTLKPSASGTTASSWNLPSGFVPSLDTSNIDPAGLSDGQVLTLFTAPSALSTDTISVNAGGRFTTAIDDNTVVATFKAGMPANYIHYDFNNGTDKNTARAADSFATIDIGGEAVGGGSNGRSAIVYNDGATRYTPYWNSYTVVDSSVASKSPMHACEMTVTTVARLKQTDMIIWGLGKALSGTAVIGLVALSPTSAAVVTKTEANVVDTVVTISNTPDLTKGYHFFAVVANASGTTLYVDNARASSEKTLPKGIEQYGQLGSFHSGAQNVDAPGANLVGAAGFRLDDFRIYDVSLVESEIRAVKREVCPDPLFIRLR